MRSIDDLPRNSRGRLSLARQSALLTHASLPHDHPHGARADPSAHHISRCPPHHRPNYLFGLQLMGAFDVSDVLIRLAMALEEELGGHCRWDRLIVDDAARAPPRDGKASRWCGNARDHGSRLAGREPNGRRSRWYDRPGDPGLDGSQPRAEDDQRCIGEAVALTRGFRLTGSKGSPIVSRGRAVPPTGAVLPAPVCTHERNSEARQVRESPAGLLRAASPPRSP